jgi:putative methionine-R-sulfoxide reductase with GAF domain
LVGAAEDTDFREWLRPRWIGGLLNLLAVAAAGGAYMLSAEAGISHGGRRILLLALGAALTGVVVLCGALKQIRDARRIRGAAQIAVDAEEALGTALNGAFAPITSYLGEMADASGRSSRATIAGKLRQAVVEAAVLLTAPDARSAFYRADSHRTRLTREAYAGRSTLPRDEFVRGTGDGDVVLDLVDRGDLVYIEDTDADPLVIPSTKGDYRTVIAVAVTAGAQRLGMLTVDATDVGELSQIDVELVRVLANLLGSGLVQAT